MKGFDFVQDRYSTICPKCKVRFRAETCILVQCKYKFFKTKITSSSRLEIIEPSEYKNNSQKELIYLNIKTMMKGNKWSHFKIIPASFSDYEEYSPNKKCMLCYQIISKNAIIMKYPKCKHLIHKRCYKKLDRFDKLNCIECDEIREYDPALNSNTNSRKKKCRQSRKHKYQQEY